MMRCLFIHQAAELYGSDRVLLELVTELQRRGVCEPIVVVPEPGPLLDEFAQRGIEVHVAQVLKLSRAIFKPSGLWRLLRAVPQALRDIDRIVAGRRIDVVHSNTLAVLGGAVWSRRRHVPHLWHVHEIVLNPKLAASGFAWLVSLAADHVVGISRMTLENLTRRRPSIARKGSVIWNGLAMPASVPAAVADQVRQAHGLDPSDVVVGLLGRINHLKGHALLLEAAALAAQRRPDLRLRYMLVGNTLAGQEQLLQQLLAQRTRLGLDGVVVHVDFVRDVWPVWAAIDIGVVPSTLPEGFGMVAIEAMAMGKPVVAAAHGGVLDIVSDGDTGWLVPPCEAEPLAQRLIELAEQPQLRARMGEAGRQRVADQFSMEAQARKFEAAYRALAGEAGGR